MRLYFLDPRPDRPRRPLSVGPPVWARSTRTLLLGLLLGLIGGSLVLAVVGIVSTPTVPRFGSDVPADLSARLRPHLQGVRDGPVWRIVADLETPWGRVVRLRPFVEEIEVRGADCVVQPEVRPDGPATDAVRLERDPATVEWREISAAVSRIAPAEKSRTIVERLVGGAGRESPASQPGATSSQGPPHRTSVHVEEQPAWFVTLHRRTDAPPSWSLHAELTLSGEAPSLSATLSPLPWSGALPDGSGPVDLLLRCDPATLEILEVRDGRILADGSSLLFDPNPVTASGRIDLRDGDEVDLWRRRVMMPDLDGAGSLRGSRVEVSTGRPPRAQEASLVFDYASTDPHFEEAMAYYHGGRSIARAESLGYSGLFRSPLHLRVHASTADNSWYSRPARQIFFGDGGVDDPEDADIILHESGHALHDAIVPGFGEGDTRAISEGFSDFWAASITGDPCIGDWDATSYSPPCLRRTDEPATWPGWLIGLPHHDGAIWSALLWDLRGLLGPREAERLALAALYEQDTGTTLTEAARGIGRAAERLGLADRRNEIREAIARRGLGPRLIEVTLAPGEARRIDLLSPGRFLHEAASALVIQGDGRLLFPRGNEALEPRPFPQGPPCAVPCGLVDPTDSPRLSAEASLEGDRASLRLSWREGATESARVSVAWNLASGEVWWEYEDLPGGAVRLYTGAAAGQEGAGSPARVVSLGLTELPAEGAADLHAFQAEIPREEPAGALSPVLGARFALTPEPGGTFLLRRVRPPISPAGDGALLFVQPNPVREQAEIRLFLRGPTRGEVSVHDVTGRRVARLADGEWPGGVTVLEWTPRVADRRLPASHYWIRLETGRGTAARRVLVLP